MKDLGRYYLEVIEEGELNITFDILEREYSWSSEKFAKQVRQDAMDGTLGPYRYGPNNDFINVDPWSVDLTSYEVLRGLCFDPTDAAWKRCSEHFQHETVNE